MFNLCPCASLFMSCQLSRTMAGHGHVQGLHHAKLYLGVSVHGSSRTGMSASTKYFADDKCLGNFQASDEDSPDQIHDRCSLQPYV